VHFSSWKDPPRRPPKQKLYRLSARDFGISLDPSPKTTFFHQYEHDLTYRLVTDDGTDQALMWLLGARNVFHRELAQMPENYISKLVFNLHHRTVVLLKSGVVLGGICLRPFPELDFAEIAFCAVSSVEQIRSYGAHLMA
jgi:histone acetyltransferase